MRQSFRHGRFKLCALLRAQNGSRVQAARSILAAPALEPGGPAPTTMKFSVICPTPHVFSLRWIPKNNPLREPVRASHLKNRVSRSAHLNRPQDSVSRPSNSVGSTRAWSENNMEGWLRKMGFSRSIAMLVGLVLLTGCASADSNPAAPGLLVSSRDFANGAVIPDRLTCNGAGAAPDLEGRRPLPRRKALRLLSAM